MVTNDEIIQPVNVAEVEETLPSLNDDSVAELYQFGNLMVTSAQQRAIRLDAKLTGVLNWSSGLLAFVLIDANVSHVRGLLFVGSLLAMLVALISVGSAYLGLRSRFWPSPSERDWFRSGFLNKPGTLRRYHVVSMLNMHQSQSEGNSKRAHMLKIAELGLVLSGLIVFVSLFARLLKN